MFDLAPDGGRTPLAMLRCQECRAKGGSQAEGWRTVAFDDPDNPYVPPIIVTYCPACAEREVGGLGEIDLGPPGRADRA